MDEYGKIKKITIEYENEIKFLYGEDAELWQYLIENMTMFCEMHNNNPFKNTNLNWKTEKKNNDSL